MLIAICLFVGIMFLIAGTFIMILGARDIAARFHISALAIGLTIVAFATSIPELLVSMRAMFKGYSEIVIFNVIGSNIINILLILSVVSFIKPLKITTSVIKKELPLSIITTALFLILSLDDLLAPAKNNIITRADALILVLFFIVYLYYMYTVIRNRKEFKKYESSRFSLGYAIMLTILGFSMIFVGSIFTVDMAYKISTYGISLKLISASIIAFATSIPELITCYHFMKNNDEDAIIGNILGSNIFNICITLALPVIIVGNLNMNSLSVIDAVNFTIAALILIIFAPLRNKVGKFESTIMIVLLLIYYGFILWEGLGL